jgi:hypothetical protein
VLGKGRDARRGNVEGEQKDRLEKLKKGRGPVDPPSAIPLHA